jgi:hypothetical protein
MHCPKCDALNRNLSLLRQAEAAAILNRHYQTASAALASNAQPAQREELIFQNRQSQAEISFALERHMRDDHKFTTEPDIAGKLAQT